MAKKRFFIESELVFAEKPKHYGFKDLEGQMFGRLAVFGYAGLFPKSYWFCKCECGNIAKVNANSLKNGATTSCGCLKNELLIKRNTTHGYTKRGQIAENFYTWSGMLKRCQNPNSPNFNDYGGRGITVCERWQKFENFLEDMGEKPEGLTLERIDNNKGYYKENCRWATRKEQANNTRKNIRLTYNGKTQSVIQWAKEMGMSQNVIYYRISSGWPVEKTLTTHLKLKHSKNVKSNP